MDISLHKQNIDRVFSNTDYYIASYQHPCRRTEERVLKLPGQAATILDAAQPVVCIFVVCWQYLKRRYL